MRSTPVSATARTVVQRYTARGFQRGGAGQAGGQYHRLAHAGEIEVVEQDQLRAGIERSRAARQRFHLDLHEYPAGGDRAARSAGSMPPAAMMWFSLMRMPS